MGTFSFARGKGPSDLLYNNANILNMAELKKWLRWLFFSTMKKKRSHRMTPQTALRTGMPMTLMPMPQSGYCRWGNCCHLQNPNPCAPFPSGSVIKNLPPNAGDAGNSGWVPGLGRSHGEGNGNPLQPSCLENPTDRRAWWVTVHGFTKSLTRLSS